MREHRFDPFTGDGVVLCDDHRPDLAPPLPPDVPTPCAFCPEHAELLGRRHDAVGDARAVAHRIPALRVEASGEPHVEGPWLRASGLGAHELLVESAVHAPLHDQPVQASLDAHALWVRRLADLRQDRRLLSFLWWREEGLSAGHHPVAQLLALPYVPEATARAVVRQESWAGRHGEPLVRAVVRAEEADGRRLLWSSPGALAVAAFAPRAAFEVWVLPRAATGFPADAPPEVHADVARGAWLARRALRAALGPVPVVTTLSAPPVGAGAAAAWHLRLRPRTRSGAVADELAATTMVSVFPEEAARVLRSALASLPGA